MFDMMMDDEWVVVEVDGKRNEFWKKLQKKCCLD
jgi:hypothetical protein